jgi:hypothetical protein
MSGRIVRMSGRIVRIASRTLEMTGRIVKMCEGGQKGGQRGDLRTPPMR